MYNKGFGIIAGREGDLINEIKPLDSKAVRQMPHCQAQTAHLRNLREPEAQAATRIG
jgi:hypothetical protein